MQLEIVLLTLLTIQLNVKLKHAAPFLNQPNTAVFDDKCMALDQTLFKLREILRLTTATTGTTDQNDSAAAEIDTDLDYNDYVYAALDDATQPFRHQTDRPRVVSSLKFSIARSSVNKNVCKIEIRVNQTIKFEFYDVHLLNRTLEYFINNADEQNQVTLTGGHVYFVFNFNYCHARKYYSVKMSDTELETVRVLAATMQKHAGILAENCKSNNAISPLTKPNISEVKQSQLVDQNELAFRPNLIMKNENYVDSDEEEETSYPLGDTTTTPPKVVQTTAIINRASGTNSNIAILRRAETTSLTDKAENMGTIYTVSTKILTYLILVLVILFLVNLVFRFNKYWFRNKYKERLDNGQASKTPRSSKPNTNSSISMANSIYFNPSSAINNHASNNEPVYENAEKQTSEKTDFDGEEADEENSNDEDDDTDEFNFFYKMGNARLNNTSKSPSTSEQIIVKSVSNITSDAVVNPKNTPPSTPLKCSDKSTAEKLAASVVEGDKRSEHSITDKAKMRYVEEWLNSISLVKYFIVNASPSFSNYDTYYYHGPADNNSRRQKRDNFRSVNL